MRYRTKPIIVEAWQWNGEDGTKWPKWIHDYVSPDKALCSYSYKLMTLYIPTLEGTMHAGFGDWIIKGVNGEIYPCKHDIFEQTYEAFAPSVV